MILLAMRSAMAAALEALGGNISAVMRAMETWRSFIPLARRMLDEPGGRAMFRKMIEGGGSE
jgi:hypothetical protein